MPKRKHDNNLDADYGGNGVAESKPSEPTVYFDRVSKAVSAVLNQELSIIEAAAKYNVLKATVQFRVQKELSELTKTSQPTTNGEAHFQAASASTFVSPPPSSAENSKKRKVEVKPDEVEHSRKQKAKKESVGKFDLFPSTMYDSDDQDGTQLVIVSPPPKKVKKKKARRDERAASVDDSVASEQPKRVRAQKSGKIVRDEGYSLRVSEAAEAFLRGLETQSQVAARFDVKKSSLRHRLEQWERVLGLNRANYGQLAHRLKELGTGIANEEREFQKSTASSASTSSKRKSKESPTSKKTECKRKTKAVDLMDSASSIEAYKVEPDQQEFVTEEPPPAESEEIVEEECEIEYENINQFNDRTNQIQILKTESLSSEAATSNPDRSSSNAGFRSLVAAAMGDMPAYAPFAITDSFDLETPVVYEEDGLPDLYEPTAADLETNKLIRQTALRSPIAASSAGVTTDVPSSATVAKPEKAARRHKFAFKPLVPQPAEVPQEISEEMAAAIASIQGSDAESPTKQPEESSKPPPPPPKPKELSADERKIMHIVERHCNRCSASEQERIVKALLMVKNRGAALPLISIAKKCDAPLLHVKKCWELVKQMFQPAGVSDEEAALIAHKKAKEEKRKEHAKMVQQSNEELAKAKTKIPSPPPAKRPKPTKSAEAKQRNTDPFRFVDEDELFAKPEPPKSFKKEKPRTPKLPSTEKRRTKAEILADLRLRTEHMQAQSSSSRQLSGQEDFEFRKPPTPARDPLTDHMFSSSARNESSERVSKYSQRKIKSPRQYPIEQDFDQSPLVKAAKPTLQERSLIVARQILMKNEQDRQSEFSDYPRSGSISPGTSIVSSMSRRLPFSRAASSLSTSTLLTPTPNSFLLWFAEEKRRFQREHPEIDANTAMVMIGKKWRSLPEPLKKKWKDKALRMKEESRTRADALSVVGDDTETEVRRGPRKGQKSTELVRNVDLKRSTPKHVLFAFGPIEERSSWAKHSRAVLCRDRPATPPRALATDALDITAHLALLGQSFTDLGERVLKHGKDEPMNVTMDVLLDGFLCALTPLLAVTQYVEQIHDAAKESDIMQSVNNAVYLMPLQDE